MQQDLFPIISSPENTGESGALFSDCRKYRYLLWRIWKPEDGLVMIIGLNPSTANEHKNDATITKVIKFAKRWGFGGVYMMNLFAFVSAYPEDLKKCEDPLGDNNYHLLKQKEVCRQVVFAWGNFKESKERAKEVIAMFPKAKALHINKDGSPKHPLYIPDATDLIDYPTIVKHDNSTGVF